LTVTRLKWVRGIILLALLAWLVAWLMFPSNPMDSLPGQDNGVFLYGGQQVLLGKTPYVDFWDHKGPLTYYLNALGLAMGSGSRWGVWILEFGFVLLAGAGIFQAASIYGGGSAGLVAVGIWAIALSQVGSYYHFRDSNYTETYALLFNVWSIYFWMRAWGQPIGGRLALTVGILAGLSFALRPNNVAAQTSLAITELILLQNRERQGGSLGRLKFMAAGALAVIFAVVLWFWVRNALFELIDAVVTYNLAYSLKNFAADTGIRVLQYGNSAMYWIPTLVYTALCGWLLIGKPKSGRVFEWRESAYLWFLMVGAVVEVLFTITSGRALLHYYILWTPYVALAGGALVSAMPARALRQVSRPQTIVLLAFSSSLLLTAVSPAPVRRYLQIIRAKFQGGGEIEMSSAVARYVNANTTDRDTVLVWGNDVWINFLSDRQAPTKYAYQYPLFLEGYTSDAKVETFLTQLQSHPPVFIVEPLVDTDEILPLNLERRSRVRAQPGLPIALEEVYAFFEANYCIEREFNEVLVYRLRAGAAVSASCP